jgi:FlaA1/EpsC-like NDP-sugar epimerase
VTLSAVISGGLTFFVGLQSFPRSVFIIDWAIILFMLGGVRYGLRGWVRQHWRQRGQRRHKALVVGAGVGGETSTSSLTSVGALAETAMDTPPKHLADTNQDGSRVVHSRSGRPRFVGAETAHTKAGSAHPAPCRR